MTLKEYLEDYASEDTRKKGEALIAAEIPKLQNPKVRALVEQHMTDLHNGMRDFRF